MTTAAAPLRISHASGLHSVNRVLADMHHEMLRVGGDDAGSVRLAVLNLVAACIDVDSADLASQAVGRLGAHHPCRALIIVAHPEATSGIEADLALQCSAVEAGQVCAEQVRLNVSGEVAYHLASVVTPLLIPDIPVFLWLVGAPPVRQAFGQDAVAICERLIIDSGAYEDHGDTLRTLADELDGAGDAISLADIAWERSRGWRLMIALSFDGEDMRALVRGITAVDIECNGEWISAQAWLLAGWLASRLDWSAAEGARRVTVTTRAVDHVADHDLLRVTLRCRHDGHEATITVERQGSALRCLIDVDGGITAERVVPTRELDTVDIVGRLLESSDPDPAYRRALRAAAGLAESAAR